MKNTIIGVLALLLVLQTVYLVRTNRETPTEAQQPLEAIPAEVVADLPPAAPEAPAEDVSTEAANQQLEKAHGLIASLYEQNQQLEADAQPNLQRGIEQMMGSPEMQGMLDRRASREAKRKYGGLLDRLNLPPEQAAALNELILQREKAEMSTGMNWMMGDIDTALARGLEARDTIHQQIAEQFGQETLDAYRYWEDTEDQRDAVTKMNQNLGEGGVDEPTSDWLVDMMYQTQGQFEELDYLSQPGNFDPRDFNPEYRGSVMEQVDQLHETYEVNAGGQLSPDQLTGFESTLQQQRRDLDRFLRFTYQATQR